MSDVWVTIGVLTVATVATRAAGPVLLGGRPLTGRLLAVIELLGPAVLAALVVTQTLSGPTGGVVIDARIAGVAAAALVLARRGSIIVVIVVAPAVTAVVRAL